MFAYVRIPYLPSNLFYPCANIFTNLSCSPYKLTNLSLLWNGWKIIYLKFDHKVYIHHRMLIICPIPISKHELAIDRKWSRLFQCPPPYSIIMVGEWKQLYLFISCILSSNSNSSLIAPTNFFPRSFDTHKILFVFTRVGLIFISMWY